MFSRKKGHRRTLSWNQEIRARYDTPLQELVGSLDRVDELVKKAREEWQAEKEKPTTPPRELGIGASFLSLRNAKKDEVVSTPEKRKKIVSKKRLDI